jgi:hypothetical protein
MPVSLSAEQPSWPTARETRPIIRQTSTGVEVRPNHPGLRNQLGKQLEPLGVQLDVEAGDAREIAARPGETRDQPVANRVDANHEDDGDRRGRAFRRQCRREADCHDHVDLATDEVGS